MVYGMAIGDRHVRVLSGIVEWNFKFSIWSTKFNDKLNV